MDNENLKPKIESSPIPPQAFIALSILAAGSFLIVLLLALLGVETSASSVEALPLLVVGALWLLPVLNALLRGERWAMILYLALLIFLTESNFRTRDFADKSFDWQVMLKGMTWLGAGLVGIVNLPRIWPILTQGAGKWALLLVMMLMASALWSPTPAYTFLSSFTYLCFLLFAMAVASRLEERDLILGLMIGTGLVVIPSLLIAPFGTSLGGINPDSTGELDRLRGMTEHPIPLAKDASLFLFLGLLWVSRYRTGRLWLTLIFLPMAFAVLLLTQSRIPPLAMLAAFAFAFAYHRGGFPLLVPVFAVGMLIFAIDATVGLMRVLPDGMFSAISRSGQMTEVTSLSGRTDIWPFVIDRIMESPWIGHGHASGVVVLKDFYRWKINHAHDTLLQTLLYVGVIGAGLMILAVFNQFKVFFAKPSIFRDTVFLFEIIKGFTEQSILSNMPGTSVLAWMITIGLATIATLETKEKPSPEKEYSGDGSMVQSNAPARLS